ARSLAAKHPADPRAAFLAGFARATESEGEHEGRRAMVLAVRRFSPAAPDWAIDLGGRFSHMLGFERASADVGELAFRAGRSPAPERAVYLPQLYLKASAPVTDPVRAEETCRRLLEAKKPDTDDRYPATWMLYAHLADARIGQEDAKGAAAFFDQAAAHAPPGIGGSIREAAAELLRSGADKRAMGRS